MFNFLPIDNLALDAWKEVSKLPPSFVHGNVALYAFNPLRNPSDPSQGYAVFTSESGENTFTGTVKLTSCTTGLSAAPPARTTTDPNSIDKIGIFVGAILENARQQECVSAIKTSKKDIYIFGFESGTHITQITAQVTLNPVDPKQNRTPHQQAILESLSTIGVCIHKKKMRTFSDNCPLGDGEIFPIEAPDLTSLGSVRPMLAQDGHGLAGTAAEIRKRKIETFFLQPKLDGVRLLVYKEGETIVALTRGGMNCPLVNEFQPELMEIFAKMEKRFGPGCCLDGEIYVHNVPSGLLGEGPFSLDGELVSSQVNKINGAVHSYGGTSKAARMNAPITSVLEFHVFTYFKIGEDKCAWDRWSDLDGIIPTYRLGQHNYVRNSSGKWGRARVPRVWRVPSEFGELENLEAMVRVCVDRGYEGVVIYNAAGFYEHKRSWNTIKLKWTETEYFPISGTEPEKSGKPFANIIYVYNGAEYVAGGFFSEKLKNFFFENPGAVVGKWAHIRYQKVTQGTVDGGALRDPKVLSITATKGGVPLKFVD